MTDEDRSRLHPALLYRVTSIPTRAPSLRQNKRRKEKGGRSPNRHKMSDGQANKP